MIKGYECGLVVAPDDPEAFAEAVVWLRDHRAEARAMGRRGRQLAEAKFARHRMGELLVRALETAHAEWNR